MILLERKLKSLMWHKILYNFIIQEWFPNRITSDLHFKCTLYWTYSHNFIMSFPIKIKYEF